MVLASPGRLCQNGGMTRRLAAVLLLLATIAFVVATFVTEPFTGYDPALFPVRIERPAIQPAGYAFSIWSVIYLWLILHAVYGLWRRSDDPVWVRVGQPLILALVLGTAWLAIAGTRPVLATVTILIMASAAVLAFLRAPTEPDRWLLSGPTAIFAGWLTAAAAVSTGILMAGYGVLSNTGAALAMLALVLTLALVVQSRKPQMPVYGLTVIWALAGVVYANVYADTGMNLTVAAAAGVGIAAMAAMLIFRRT